MAMEEKEAEEEEGSEFRIQTRRTTVNIQIETGVRIAMSSSPNESNRLLGLWFRSIGYSKISVLASQIDKFEEDDEIEGTEGRSFFQIFVSVRTDFCVYSSHSPIRPANRTESVNSVNLVRN